MNASLIRFAIMQWVMQWVVCVEPPFAASGAKLPAAVDADIGDDTDKTWALTLVPKDSRRWLMPFGQQSQIKLAKP